jgi:hypothetical protein
LRKRITKVTRTRHYRLTKKHPKRSLALLKLDHGDIEQQIAVFFPEKSQYLNVQIPKEKNPDLFSIRMGDLKIVFYTNENKGFFYDENGMFLGRYEKHDLKNAFFKFGSILKLLKKQNG